MCDKRQGLAFYRRFQNLESFDVRKIQNPAIRFEVVQKT